MLKENLKKINFYNIFLRQIKLEKLSKNLRKSKQIIRCKKFISEKIQISYG